MDKAVVKAFGLLEMLARSDTPLGVTELARRADLGRSNVHRLLQTLQSLGYVTKTDDTLYAPTLQLWELGSQVVGRLSVREQSRPSMQLLSDMSKETVHLSELAGTDVLYIDKIESQEPVRAYTQLGGRGPACCTATGKAILAFSDEALVARCLESAQPFTQKSITNATRFAAEMAQVRQRRYALNLGEWRADIIGIAAPILGDSGSVIAAIGLSAPASRVRVEEFETLAPTLVDYAERISRAMGCAAALWDMAGGTTNAPAKAPTRRPRSSGPRS